MIDGIKNMFWNITKLNKRQICESIHPMSHSDVYQILKQTSNDLEFLKWYSVFGHNFSSYNCMKLKRIFHTLFLLEHVQQCPRKYLWWRML